MTIRLLDHNMEWQCAFIISAPRVLPAMCCGEIIDRGAYCKEHADLSYVPVIKRRRERLERLGI